MAQTRLISGSFLERETGEWGTNLVGDKSILIMPDNKNPGKYGLAKLESTKPPSEIQKPHNLLLYNIIRIYP